MQIKPPEESGMQFGSFNADCFWAVETSPTYQSIKKAGVCSVEFIVKQGSRLVFLEARMSAPHPHSQERFDPYINEVVTKFIHSVTLLLAVRHHRHDVALVESLRHDLLAKPVLTLVIKNHDIAWLPPVQHQLRKVMRPYLRLWNLHDECVEVLNEAMAKRKGLIE